MKNGNEPSFASEVLLGLKILGLGSAKQNVMRAFYLINKEMFLSAISNTENISDIIFCNKILADLQEVHLAFQTLVGYFAVHQFLLSDRFRFSRNYLENYLENSAFFYGFCLFLIFPGMVLVQNFLISLFMNINRTKFTLISILKHLLGVSKTNVTFFPEIDIFSFQEKDEKDYKLIRMICSYLSMCLLPIITCTLIAYPFYDFTICSARARF